MRRFTYTLFLLPLFFSCAKNGEYKVCNEDITFTSSIISNNPNSDICYIDNYKDDQIMSRKCYVDDKLIYESKRVKGSEGLAEQIEYNKKGDTTNYSYDTDEYKYNLFPKFDEKYEKLGYQIRVDYKNRADISELLYQYDKDDKLILGKTHCRDKKGNFCKCPNDKTDKFLTKFHNERALEKQRRNANTNFLDRP